MATLTIKDYDAIQSNIFVRIDIAQYKANAGSAFAPQVLRFSDSITPRTFNGEVYTSLGKLMSISSSASELQVTGNQVSVAITAIPNSAIYEIVNSKIKTSPISIFRAFYDPSTGDPLDIPNNPIGRFNGIIANYALTEEWDPTTRTSTNTIVFTCASQVDILQKKIAGRCTSSSSMKKYFPSDVSMDRVSVLEKATFDFGKQSTSSGSSNGGILENLFGI
jgi:hypothetical protein